jgi:hypothetical protein
MHPNTICQRKTPTGLSFAVSELLTAISWAERNGLGLYVVLDWVIDEAEYEEILILTGAAQPLAQHVLWRTANAVFEQHVGAPPRAFRNLHGALNALAPTSDGQHWTRRIFGTARAKGSQ